MNLKKRHWNKFYIKNYKVYYKIIMKYILYGLALIPLAWIYSIVIGNNYKIQNDFINYSMFSYFWKWY